jgi:quinol monooxygenase YgiN
MSEEIAVVAIAVAKPGLEAEVEAAIRPCIPETHKEAGCRLYTVHTDLDQPNRFVFIERWASREALEAHKLEPHFLTMAKALESRLAEPFEVLVLRELP